MTREDGSRLSAHPYYDALERFRSAVKILSGKKYRRDRRRGLMRACTTLEGLTKSDLPARLSIDFVQWRNLADEIDGSSSEEDFAACEQGIQALSDVLEQYFQPAREK